MIARNAYRFWTKAGLLAAFLMLQATVSVRADLAQAEAALAARDYDGAILALQPLVAAGDGYATWKMAELYLAGHGGTETEGLALLQQAASAGEPEAQARLGVMYAKGTGVAQNDIEAYKWLSLAARGAAPGISRTVTQTNRTVVSQRLTPDQRMAAETASDAASAAYQIPATAEPLPATTPEPEPAAVTAIEPAAPSPAVAGGYRIQLASIPNANDVPMEWARLKKRIGAPIDRLDLYVEQADLGSKGIYHRLQVGPFATHREAIETCSTIKAGGADCLVVGP